MREREREREYPYYIYISRVYICLKTTLIYYIYMGRTKGTGRMITSVTVSPEFFVMAKDLNISFTEALRVGLSLMFAERGVKEYDNDLNVVRRAEQVRLKLEEVSNELSALKEKHGV